jgi:hypothetical protein
MPASSWTKLIGHVDRGHEGDPTNLLHFMLDIAGRAESVLLGTAIPIQIDRMELYDLMRILHRSCERVLGGIGSNWRHKPGEAMNLVAGRSEPPTSIAELWAWLRDLLIPRSEHPVATQIRSDLAVPDSQTADRWMRCQLASRAKPRPTWALTCQTAKVRYQRSPGSISRGKSSIARFGISPDT